jgi:hypothetical protein
MAVAGCSLKDALSGHQDVVATSAGQELTVERVAAMIAPAKSVPLRREVVDRVAELWVDYQLLAQAVASGDSLLDSATVNAANWPLIVQMLANGYHDSVVALTKPTDAQLDSAYNGNDYRYVSHILVAVRRDTTPAVLAAKRRTAEGYLAQLQHGANFAQLAGRVSEDPGSKPNGGAYFISRGQMVKPFEDAAFTMTSGQLLPTLVQSDFGFHIMRRPALAEVRDSFSVHLSDILLGRADSVFLDSLTNKTGISVRGRAPAIVKAAANNLRAAKGRSRTLATWRGGSLSEHDLATWLQAFPPQTRQMVGQAPDSTLVEFVKSIARNQQIIDAARKRHINLTAGQRDSLRTHYRDDLHQMLTGMGLAAESLAADTMSRGASRSAVAARRVDAYFTAITNTPGARQYYEVPPFLADVLRARFSWKINAAGVDRALERAKVLRGPETPQAPAGMPNMSPAPIQPAPGGPPVAGPPRRSIR